MCSRRSTVRLPRAAFQAEAQHRRGHAESSADLKTWTIRIRPDIFFADDPAFKGQRRELLAEDYVYAIKRTLDRRRKRERALVTEAPFNDDTPVEGLRALDRLHAELQAEGAAAAAGVPAGRFQHRARRGPRGD